MKKLLSVILAVCVVAGTTVMLSSCGKNSIKKSDFEAIEEAFDGVNFVDVLDKKNVSEVTVANEDEKSDNVVYSDEKDGAGFIMNKENKKVAVTGFAIKDALYKDIDGDGYEEVFASGYNSHRGSTTAALYDYTTSLLMDENGNSTKALELVAEASFEGDVNIGFYEDADGKVHVVSKKADGTIDKDYGVASQNGLLLEIGDYNNLSKVTDKPDTSFFVTDDYTYYFNGKEFKPEADFAYGEEGIVPPISYIDKAAFEELIGQSYKSLGKELDSRAIMVINGKEYVSWFTLRKTYDIIQEMPGKDEVFFKTLDYKEPETTKKSLFN